MGNPNKPRHDDQDNDGIPDNGQSQSQVHSGNDADGDGIPEGDSGVTSNPIIINPNR